jgi:hypothetical protein
MEYINSLDGQIMEPQRLVKQLDFALQTKKQRELDGRRRQKERTVERQANRRGKVFSREMSL